MDCEIDGYADLVYVSPAMYQRLNPPFGPERMLDIIGYIHRRVTTWSNGEALIINATGGLALAFEQLALAIVSTLMAGGDISSLQLDAATLDVFVPGLGAIGANIVLVQYKIYDVVRDNSTVLTRQQEVQAYFEEYASLSRAAAQLVSDGLSVVRAGTRCGLGTVACGQATVRKIRSLGSIPSLDSHAQKRG